MFPLHNNLKCLTLTIETFAKNYANLQTVRWVRKPWWMPMAKSKLFKIPPRPVIPKEDVEELKRLHNNYRTQMKSIRRYLILRYNEKFQASLDPKQIEREFEVDFAKCVAINEQWNNEQRILREKRTAEELEKEISFAKERLVLERQRAEEALVQAEEIVRREKEVAKTFILPEALDAAIEYALANPVDYNYAIDADGNKIIGRETVPQAAKAS